MAKLADKYLLISVNCDPIKNFFVSYIWCDIYFYIMTENIIWKGAITSIIIGNLRKCVNVWVKTRYPLKFGQKGIRNKKLTAFKTWKSTKKQQK